MKRAIFRRCIPVLLALFALTTLSLAADAPAKGRLEKKSDMWVLHVEGTPYEMGFQQGSLMKEQIKKIYEIYLYEKVINEWTKQYGMMRDPKAMRNPRGALLAKARLMEKHIPQDLIDEMKGIADGSGMPYEDVLILTSHVDYFAILCSGFAAYGPLTRDGHLVHGRNLDWAKGGLRDLDPFSTVIVYKPAKGKPFVSIGYPGIMGVLTGFNANKISTELNFSMAKGDENSYDGTPVMILMRMITQNADSVPAARKILADAKRTAGYSILVSDGKNDTAELIEITGKTIALVAPEKNYVLTTNHFTSKELADKSMTTSFGSSNSISRYDRLHKLILDNSGKIDAAKAIEMIQDDQVRVDGTVQSVVFVPGQDKFWVWARNRKLGDFVEFNLNDLISEKLSSN